MRRLIGMLLMALLALAGSAVAAEQQKVVYHINSGDAGLQTAALRNVQNHIVAAGADNVDIIVVMHGDGLSLLLYPEELAGTKMKSANATEAMQVKVAALKEQGVRFQVCANTVKGRKVPVDGLYDVHDGDIVPSGVAQLAILQSQGYAYIKP